MTIVVSSGTVIEINTDNDRYQDLIVLYENGLSQSARLYKKLCNKARIDDRVLVNITARVMGLGTGGFDFVISNLSDSHIDKKDSGHIMKFRYTPLQFGVNSLEESLHYKLAEYQFTGLNNMPVIVAELHSMLPAFVMGLTQYAPGKNVVYIMTDGGALTADFSDNLEYLIKHNLLSCIISIGNAYGGELEAVNIYSALIAAHSMLKADIVLVGIGPGIVGTGTRFGFTGINQVYILDTVNKLSGRRVLIPRLSFKENRSRHFGISHHTLTVLQFADSGIELTLPSTLTQNSSFIIDQLLCNDFIHKHKISWLSPESCHKILSKSEAKLETMGRSFKKDTIFFETAFVAGKKAALE